MSLRRRRLRCDWRRRSQQWLLFGDVEPRFADKLGDRRGIQARGIVLDVQRSRRAIEAQLPDAVHIARVGQRRRHLLRGRRDVAKNNVDSGHKSRIPASIRSA